MTYSQIQRLLQSYHINGQLTLDYLTNLENTLPNIIISDVIIPEMDGFTFLKHCKNNKRLLSVPVVMLIARSVIEDRLNALRIGVDDYLIKPFLVDELLIRVKNLLSNVQNRSESNDSNDSKGRGIYKRRLREK